jgi:Protein of unknown function (DUF3987)
MEDYKVSASAFIGAVGVTGDGKSPALKAIARPFRERQYLLLGAYRADFKQWKADCVAAKQNKVSPPEPPRLGCVMAKDFTTEALLRELAKSPRGLFCAYDELGNLLGGLNQYRPGGKGNDRQRLLEIWNHAMMMIHRVHHEEGIPVIIVPRPFVGIAGCINVGSLPLFLGPNRSGAEDGGIERFLFAYPDQLPRPGWGGDRQPTPKVLRESWRTLITRLLDRPMDPLGTDEFVPHVYTFNKYGAGAWRDFYNEHDAEINKRDFPPELRGPWIKLAEYAGRFALTLALAEYATTTPDEEYLDNVTDNNICKFNWEDAVINAWSLVGYFKSQVRRVQAMIEKLAPAPVGANESRDIQEALHWIEKKKCAVFQAKELDNLRCFRGDTRRRDKTLGEMEQRHHIRRLPEVGLKGKKPSPSYEVSARLRTWETTPKEIRQEIRQYPPGNPPQNSPVTSDPNHSGERTSGEELVPDSEEIRQIRQRGESPHQPDDPLFTEDHPFSTDTPSLPSQEDSWEPPSLPSSEDLLSSALLPSDSSPDIPLSDAGGFGGFPPLPSSEAHPNPLREDELDHPASSLPLPNPLADIDGFPGGFPPPALPDPTDPPLSVPDRVTGEAEEPPVELSPDGLDAEKEKEGDQ